MPKRSTVQALRVVGRRSFIRVEVLGLELGCFFCSGLICLGFRVVKYTPSSCNLEKRCSNSSSPQILGSPSARCCHAQAPWVALSSARAPVT